MKPLPTIPPKPDLKQIASVQILRAFAALLVCVAHVLQEASHVSNSPLLASMVNLPWGVGVDIFFIISGYIMMHTSAAAFTRPGATRDFMLRRLIRIIPPYWFFTTCIVAIAIVLPAQLDRTVFTPAHALQSYLFVPHLDPINNASINPILALGWTLLYEMFFYTAFAFALFLRRPLGLGVLLVGFVALFVGATQGLFTPALNIFWSNSIMFEFLLGIMLYLMLMESTRRIPTYIALTLFALAAFSLTYLFPALANQRFLTQGMPALMLFLTFYPLFKTRTLVSRGLVLVGDASYTLYLSHPFALTAVKLAFKPLVGLLGVAFVPVYALAALLASIIGAVVFYVVIESRVTRALQKRLLPRKKA